MNLLRVSITAASHKTFRHILRNAVSSNVNTMISGFTTAAGKSKSEMNRRARVKRLSPNKTILIDLLCKQDRIDEAYRVLNEAFVSGISSPSFVTLNDVLRGFLRIGETKKAYEMYNEIDKRISKRWIDEDTKSSLFRCLSDEVTYTNLMNAYLDEGKWDNAEKKIKIYGYGKCDYANKLYHQMERFGYLPDSVRYSVFINGLDDNKARTTQIKKELLSFNYDCSLDRPTIEYHRTLAENCSHDEFKSLVELVEGFCIKGLENPYETMLKWNYMSDGIVYNLFIIVHCKHYNADEAYNIYKEMVCYGFPCHMFTVLALIKTLHRELYIIKRNKEDMVNELLWVIQNVLRSCNLNDSEILKFLNEFNPKKPNSEALFNVLAEKAKDGLFLKCLYAPPSA